MQSLVESMEKYTKSATVLWKFKEVSEIGNFANIAQHRKKYELRRKLMRQQIKFCSPERSKSQFLQPLKHWLVFAKGKQIKLSYFYLHFKAKDFGTISHPQQIPRSFYSEAGLMIYTPCFTLFSTNGYCQKNLLPFNSSSMLQFAKCSLD